MASASLMRWYEPRRSAYPWRARPTPYRVLVSEIMLQQTQAARVAPVFDAFLARFPSVRALASAPRAEVLRAWSGLGYNRRAVNLHRAAAAIVRDHEGRVPRDPRELRELPGVGPYTANAVASIAYALPVAALDVNVSRVVRRAWLGDDGASGDRIAEEAAARVDAPAPGAWNQALMDVGREHCRPVPRCAGCPLARACRYRRRPRGASPAGRVQGRFEGSSRQVRGALVRALVEAPERSLATIARSAGASLDRVHRAALALEREGLVALGPAARRGRARGRVRLRGSPIGADRGD